jgi:hypothetical protein
MLLHFIDRGLRHWRGVQPVKIVSADVLQAENGSSVTKLRLHAPHIHGRAGDYVFLCIPAISHLEYHPFSISSDPTRTDGIVDFHILRLGVGTFTAQVADWAANEAITLTDEVDAVKLDGIVSCGDVTVARIVPASLLSFLPHTYTNVRS